MKNKLLSWKYPFLLLFGIGTSNIGDWIYLIALNVMMLDMPNSPLAVSGLYMIKPLAALCTNIWSGSLIDRMNKRKLMMFLDWMRGDYCLLSVFLIHTDHLCAGIYHQYGKFNVSAGIDGLYHKAYSK